MSKNFRAVVLNVVLSSFLVTSLSAQEYKPGVIRVKFKENYGSAVAANHAARQKTGLAEVDKLNTDIGIRSMRRVFRESGKYEKAHRAFGLHLWYEINLDESADLKSVINRYKKLSYFDVVEPFVSYQIIDPLKSEVKSQAPASLTGPTNDPLFYQQWHYENTGQTGGTPGSDISLAQAWALQTGSDKVIVAVIDQGIDIAHPDLAASMWTNENEIPNNGIDDDNNGYIDDVNGYGFADGMGTIYPGFHGTHVGGTIAAVTNNGVGVSGIAGGNGTGNGVRLMSCAAFGYWNYAGGFEDAMVYAADNGAVISQNSWGGGSSAIEAAIDYFIARAGYDNSDDNFTKNIQTGPMAGGIVIFAAGNSNSNYGYPASYPPVMAVAATDHNDKRAYFSNYGDWIDISAPGVDVLSTCASPYDTYAWLSGTSMACPHVSGVAGLIISEFGKQGYSPNQVWDRLQFTTDNIDDQNPDFKGKLGAGRVNAFQALQQNDGVPPDPINDLVLKENLLTSVILSWTSTGSSGLTGAASFYDLRYSTSPINEGNFDAATKISKAPRPLASGSTQEFEVTGLSHSTIYYFGMKAGDYFGNISGLSNVVAAETLEPPVINVSPASLIENLFTGGKSTQYLTIKNTGKSDLHLKAKTSVSANPSSVIGNFSLINPPLNREENATPLLYQVLPGQNSARPGSMQSSAPSSVAIPPLPNLPQGFPQKLVSGSIPHPPHAQQPQLNRPSISSEGTGKLFSLDYYSQSIIEFHPQTGENLRSIPVPESISGGPDGLAYDGRYLYFVNAWNSNSIYRIDANTGEKISKLTLSNVGEIDGLACSSKYIYAMLYGNPGRILEIDYDKGEIVRTLQPNVPLIGGITFGGSRGTLFAAYSSAAVYEIDIETGKVINLFVPPGVFYGLGYSEGAQVLFAANVSNELLQALDPDNGTVKYSFPGYWASALASDEAGVRWLSVVENKVTLPPGSTHILPVNFDASALNGGTYTGSVVITSNDPVTPTVNVPVTLHVTGAPDIELKPKSIDFRERFVSAVADTTVIIENKGTDVLHVNSISLSNAVFSITPSEPFSLNAGKSKSLTLKYQPVSVGTHTASLTIQSNDPDDGFIEISVTGKAVNPPVIQVSPASLSASLFTGEKTERMLSIKNSGESVLKWSLSYDIENDFSTGEGEFTSKKSSPSRLTCVSADMEGRIYGQTQDGYSFYRYNPGEDSWTTLATSSVYQAYGAGVYLNEKIYNASYGSPYIGVYDIASDSWSYLSNEFYGGTLGITTDGTNLYLAAYDGSLKRLNLQTNTWTTLATAPMSFIFGLEFYNNNLYAHDYEGRFMQYSISSDLWTILPNVPNTTVIGSALDRGVYYAYGPYYGNEWFAFDIRQGTWKTSVIPLFVVGYGGIAAVGSGSHKGIYIAQGDTGTGFGKYGLTANWLSAEVNKGTTQAKSQSDLKVMLDATGLSTGEYKGKVNIQSNDPKGSMFEVPVTLTVTNALSVTPNPLKVYVEPGQSKTVNITIANSRSTPLDWKMTDPSSKNLNGVMSRLNQNYASVTNLIPDRYNFSEGEYGYYIYNGGENMYNWGNLISTSNSWNYVNYSDRAIVTNSQFGETGSYFTAKYPGLFVMAANTNGLENFVISGQLGNWGSATVDGTVITTTHNGKTYKAFIKRVYNHWTPSVNHLIIVENAGDAWHSYNSYSYDDYHILGNLGNVKRLYYLLFAGQAGGYINNNTMLQITNKFLEMAEGNNWLALNTLEGTINGKANQVISATFNSAGLAVGTYQTEIFAHERNLSATRFDIPVAFYVGVNQQPRLLSRIPDQSLALNDSPVQLNLNDYFVDDDGETLTYVFAAPSNVALVNLAGSSLTIAPNIVGEMNVTINGVDRANAQVSATFKVKVSPITDTGKDLYNIPNPFPYNTVIRYELKSGGLVQLIVQDVTGKTIRTLADEEQLPGQYEVNYKGEGIQSGLYFYRLIVNGKTVGVRKMVKY